MQNIDPLRAIAKKDGRYHLEAYTFLYDALDTTVELLGIDSSQKGERHVSGQELLEGMRVHALRAFGPLAAQVWRHWGVRATDDWGRIVFNLVEGELLRRQDSDTIDDFRDGFDFDEAFIKQYEPSMPAELDAVPRSQVRPQSSAGSGASSLHPTDGPVDGPTDGDC